MSSSKQPPGSSLSKSCLKQADLNSYYSKKPAASPKPTPASVVAQAQPTRLQSPKQPPPPAVAKGEDDDDEEEETVLSLRKSSLKQADDDEEEETGLSQDNDDDVLYDDDGVYDDYDDYDDDDDDDGDDDAGNDDAGNDDDDGDDKEEMKNKLLYLTPLLSNPPSGRDNVAGGVSPQQASTPITTLIVCTYTAMSKWTSHIESCVDLPRYNLYFPPGPKDSVECALLLIPGAVIDPVAYAHIARQLSDQGVLVAVLNTGPYYLPSTLLGACFAHLKLIMREITSQHEVKEWAIGGHDMGTIPAMQLVEKLELSKLVLWGAYDPWNVVNLSRSKVNVLVVMPSNDMYWKVLSEAQISKFRSKLPPEAGTASTPNRGCSVYKMLEGGNHSGFAHYGPVKEDGERTISSQEQQKLCVTVTALFLKNFQSFYYGRNA